MTVNESAENYLETILILSRQLPVVRSVEIALEDACKIEHVISKESFEAIRDLIR